MEKKNKNRITIVLMGVIIVILTVLCVLFATGTISFNSNTNNHQINDEIDNTNKDKISDSEGLNIGKKLYDKATDAFETWTLVPYCGEYSSNNKYEGKYGFYHESNFNNIDELKEYLKTFLSNDIVDRKVNGIAKIDLSNIDDYENYIIYNNKLYCREFSGKGWLSSYLKYDLSIKNITENKIVYDIKSYYAKGTASDDCINSSGPTGETSRVCNDSEMDMKETNFTIEKINGNWIVTDYILHE